MNISIFSDDIIFTSVVSDFDNADIFYPVHLAFLDIHCKQKENKMQSM